MKNLLYKEIRLGITPVLVLFLTFPAMLLIPNYPRFVPYFYICLATFFVFNNAQLNKDLQYSMILPIRKRDMVKARALMVASYQLLSIAIGIPFAILSRMVPNTYPGLGPNLAFFGLNFIPMALFNLVLFTMFYRKAEKPQVPFIIGAVIWFIIFAVIDGTFIAGGTLKIPFIATMASMDPADFGVQIPFLIFGLLFYFGIWILTYRIAANRFEKVDL